MAKPVTIKWLRECQGFQSGVRCPHAKSMAEFIAANFPELAVTIREGSERRHTKPRGCRYITGGGRRLYTGYHIEVKWKDRPDEYLFSHKTYETYRQNYEIARFIVEIWDKLRKGA